MSDVAELFCRIAPLSSLLDADPSRCRRPVGAKTPTQRKGIKPFPAFREVGMIAWTCSGPTLRGLTGLKA